MTIEMVARRLGVSRVQVSRILNGRSSIPADMAIRIDLLTHTTPESWLAGQTKWPSGRLRKSRAPHASGFASSVFAR